MDFSAYFRGFDRKLVTKLTNHLLIYIKTEYDKSPENTPERIVNTYLNKIELPKEIYPIILMPSFQTIIDLYNFTRQVWNPELKHFPAPSEKIKEKMPCDNPKMIRFAKFLLQKCNVEVNIDEMSFQEISAIIDKLKPEYESLEQSK